MTASPFVHMACSLTLRPAHWHTEQAEATKSTSRTERIRQLLRAARRPVTAAEIAFDMADDFPNFGSHLVWLLLKYDINKGRVTLTDGLYAYRHDFDTAAEAAVRDAVKLLKAHGYKLKAPQ